MSHASVIVALSPQDIEAADSILDAVAFQMDTFKEGSELFADGSRWDWYQVGGRYTGTFDGYDPETDPANIVSCEICQGTGLRNDQLGRDHRLLNPEYTCNGCDGAGQRVEWPTQWVEHAGDITTRANATELVGEDRLTAYAFLRNREWRERSRLGWWAMEAKTECEIARSDDNGESFTGRCLHTCERTGARVISYAEGEDESRWSELFWPRFIRELPPDTTLVVVDYHI
jgi:hypothetical protein